MAFNDPQSIKIGADTAVPLPRTGSGVNTGSFKSNDSNIQLDVQSAYNKRTQRSARLTHSKIAPDPLISSQNIKYSMSAYLRVDTPVTGYTVDEQKAIVQAIIDWATASSGANITKLLGGEN
jgi:hypothetical protein